MIDISSFVNELAVRGLKIALAESITGGMIAEHITSVPGSSAVMECSVVTYSDNAKHTLLGVKRETLEKYTAVSENTAREMAQGILSISNADIAVAVTGYAGPAGASVGTVYIGCAIKNGKTHVCKCFFEGNREEIRLQTVQTAIQYAVEAIRSK